MDNELPPDRFKSLWQNQSVEPVRMSLEEIQQKAVEFQRRIQRRNLREYIAAAFVLVAFSWSFWRFPAMRLGCSLILAATGYVIYQLHTKGAAKTVPESLALGTCIDFHRRELERQRDLVGSVWKWYLLPFVPGLLVVVAVPVLHSPPGAWVRGLPFLLVCAAVFYATWRLNKRSADRLQQQIDELNSLRRD